MLCRLFVTSYSTVVVNLSFSRGSSAMCGRYTLRNPQNIDVDLFGVERAPALCPSYNIAPGQLIPVVIERASDARRGLALLRWGLLPHWCDDPSVGFINARSETASRSEHHVRCNLQGNREVEPDAAH